jgi:hypothetical protein
MRNRNSTAAIIRSGVLINPNNTVTSPGKKSVDGRFNQTQLSNLPLRTNRNQVLCLFTDRYIPADFSEQLTEVSMKEDGRVEVTGFPTLGLPSYCPPLAWLGLRYH